jgi:hypothetical protein
VRERRPYCHFVELVLLNTLLSGPDRQKPQRIGESYLLPGIRESKSTLSPRARLNEVVSTIGRKYYVVVGGNAWRLAAANQDELAGALGTAWKLRMDYSAKVSRGKHVAERSGVAERDGVIE